MSGAGHQATLVFKQSMTYFEPLYERLKKRQLEDELKVRHTYGIAAKKPPLEQQKPGQHSWPSSRQQHPQLSQLRAAAARMDAAGHKRHVLGSPALRKCGIYEQLRWPCQLTVQHC